ncbi:MAG TPA: dethiobiotin synthase [Solirubrobacteraceae bacterium]|nr:dethiobiotin synthase [Solirubrobacteraceae bacterium]
MRGLFVTGTDTGVGKTVLSAALLAALRSAGEPVLAYKPAVTGLDEPPASDGQAQWPADHELLAAAAAMAPEDVAPLRYGPAVSPQLAAEMAGAPLARERVLDGAREALAAATEPVERREGAERSGRTLVVEGVGGLLSPLAEEMTVCDLAVAMRLPLLIAARPGLGTVNHTLLTLQVARASGLSVRAVVLTPWPEHPSRLEQSNRAAIARLGFVEVDTLARAATPTIDELARVGSELPWRRWLGESARVAQAAT